MITELKFDRWLRQLLVDKLSVYDDIIDVGKIEKGHITYALISSVNSRAHENLGAWRGDLVLSLRLKRVLRYISKREGRVIHVHSTVKIMFKTEPNSNDMGDNYPNYEILEDTDTHVLLKDVGPWDQYPTITNAAEKVVKKWWKTLNGRELRYIDSEGDNAKLTYDRDEFIGFDYSG